MKLRRFSIVCGLCVVGAVTASASAIRGRYPCPPSCNSDATHRMIDPEESEYTCCTTGGRCTVCEDCPWYLEFWC
jgi:hypothetical protein